MIQAISIDACTAVPHLAGSSMAISHKGKVSFSTTKPNVIVGPNGAGKSALVTALALSGLAYFTGKTSLDRHYINGLEADTFWTPASRWGYDEAFLKGIQIKGMDAPVTYYRPHHIPGNEGDVGTAMFTGYFELAKNFGNLTENKSSGQACQAMLDDVFSLLQGTHEAVELKSYDFNYTDIPLEQLRGAGRYDYRAATLRQVAKSLMTGNVPLLLMDEPEQSLDALTEMKLWKAIQKSDAGKVQVIVATHSLYPILHPEHFNIIETHSGYAMTVRDLLT